MDKRNLFEELEAGLKDIKALAFDKMIQRGLEDVKNRRVTSHEEMKKKIFKD